MRRFPFTVAAAVPRIPSLDRRHSIGRAWERPKGIVGLVPSSGYAAALAGARLPRPGHHGFAPVATICRLLRRLRSFLAESQFPAPDLPQTCTNGAHEAKLGNWNREASCFSLWCSGSGRWTGSGAC